MMLLTMSEYVDSFVVQIKEGFEASYPIVWGPIMVEDIFVEPQMTWNLMNIQQFAIFLIFIFCLAMKYLPKL